MIFLFIIEGLCFPILNIHSWVDRDLDLNYHVLIHQLIVDFLLERISSET